MSHPSPEECTSHLCNKSSSSKPHDISSHEADPLFPADIEDEERIIGNKEHWRKEEGNDGLEKRQGELLQDEKGEGLKKGGALEDEPHDIDVDSGNDGRGKEENEGRGMVLETAEENNFQDQELPARSEDSMLEGSEKGGEKKTTLDNSDEKLSGEGYHFVMIVLMNMTYRILDSFDQDYSTFFSSHNSINGEGGSSSETTPLLRSEASFKKCIAKSKCLFQLSSVSKDCNYILCSKDQVPVGIYWRLHYHPLTVDTTSAI